MMIKRRSILTKPELKFNFIKINNLNGYTYLESIKADSDKKRIGVRRQLRVTNRVAVMNQIIKGRWSHSLTQVYDKHQER